MTSEASLFNFFDQSYVINLPERLDRRQEMQQELRRMGWDDFCDRVSLFPAVKPTDKEDFPSLGARGCFLSHLGVLREAQSRSLSHLLIMEDDLAFHPLLIKKQQAVIQALQSQKWDFAYLGHGVDVPQGSIPLFRPYSEPLMLTHFLAVNRSIVDRLVSFLEEVLKRPAGHPDGGPMHVDGAYSTFRMRNPDVITLIAYPSLGYQRSSPSDVAGYQWFDRLPGLAQLAAIARKSRNWYKQRQP